MKRRIRIKRKDGINQRYWVNKRPKKNFGSIRKMSIKEMLETTRNINKGKFIEDKSTVINNPESHVKRVIDQKGVSSYIGPESKGRIHVITRESKNVLPFSNKKFIVMRFGSEFDDTTGYKVDSTTEANMLHSTLEQRALTNRDKHWMRKLSGINET